MTFINYASREINCKIVYYGPGLCGKTTNLQYIHGNLPDQVKGKMLSLATKTDRTLFFDFLPIDLGDIRGMKTRVQLYTVPGQVFYNETRKLVLKGADGIVFVADSQEAMLNANMESFKNLEENLKGHALRLADMPHVIQFNKRDLPKLASIEDLNAGLNKFNAPFYESVATTGIGVQDTLKAIVKLVLLNLTKKYETKSGAETVLSNSVPAAHAAAGTISAAPLSPPPMSRAATAVALSPETAPAPAPAAPTAKPATVKHAAPPKAKAGKKSQPPPALAPVETMSPFAEEEIDGLVGEVEEIESIEVAVPMSAAPVAPASPELPAEEGAWLGLPEDSDEAGFADHASTFGANQSLEELLGRDAPAQDAAPASAPEWIPVASGGSEFEIDRGFDPEWAHVEEPAPAPEPPRMQAAPPVESIPFAPTPDEDDLRPIAPFPIPDRDDVLLTEVASDADLFTDPSLEIARLADGEAREIVVPVMLGEGASAKRYKLAIRLRLDAVD